MRVIAPALAGVLMGAAGPGPAACSCSRQRTSVIAGVVLLGLPRAAPPPVRRDPRWTRSPTRSRYVRRTHGLALIALTTIGVVIVGFPYMTFLPAIADEASTSAPAATG